MPERWAAIFAALAFSLALTQAQYHDNVIPIAVRPIEEPLFPDSHDFEPTHSINIHSINATDGTNPYELITWTWMHSEFSYVSLEAIEPWLAGRRVRCDNRAIARNLTTLVLPFENLEAFDIAKKKWRTDEKLLFVVEGERCFEGPGERSVYRSHSIHWDKRQSRAIIEAMPLRAYHTIRSGWAERVRWLPYDQVPYGFYPEPRPSTGYSWRMEPAQPHHLEKRFLHHDWEKSFEWDLGHHHNIWETTADTSKPHVSIPRVGLACIDCHGSGSFKAGVNIEFNFSKGRHRDEQPGCLLSRSEDPSALRRARIDHRHEGYMEITRRKAHVRDHQARLAKRELDDDQDYFAAPSCPESDSTYPICTLDDIAEWHAKCDNDNILLHPPDTLKKVFECIRATFHSDHDCWHDFTDASAEFEDIKHYLTEALRANMDEANAYFNVTDPINFRFQLQLEIDAGVGAWLDLDLMLTPAGGIVLVPSFGFSASEGGGPSQIITVAARSAGNTGKPGGHDPNRPKGGLAKPAGASGQVQGGTGNGMSMSPVSLSVTRLEGSITFAADMNATFPGLDVQMSTGELAVDLLAVEKERIITNTITTNLTYLNADLSFGPNPSVTVAIAAGPAISVNLIPFAIGMLGNALSFGAHFQVVRLDHIFTKASARDETCQALKRDKGDTEPYRGGIKIEQDFRIGALIYASIFFQRVLDGSWLGKLQDKPYAIPGLFYSWNTGNFCIEFSAEEAEKPDNLNAWLTKKLRAAQEPLATLIEAFEHTLNAWRDKTTLYEEHMKDLNPMQRASRFSWVGHNFDMTDHLQPPKQWGTIYEPSPAVTEADKALLEAIKQRNLWNLEHSHTVWATLPFGPPSTPLVSNNSTDLPSISAGQHHINSTRQNQPGLAKLLAEAGEARHSAGET